MAHMPESPEQLYNRVANDLRMPAVADWDTFPFDGDMRPRALRPPVENEAPRSGAGGVACWACSTPDADYVWSSERWRVRPTVKPTGLPLILFLEPRAHFADPGDLPDELAAELGTMLSRVERAVRSIDGVGRVHVCRWGDGTDHLHWWFIARPARMPQLIGSFAAIWHDILPPVPEAIWKENIAIVVQELANSPGSARPA